MRLRMTAVWVVAAGLLACGGGLDAEGGDTDFPPPEGEVNPSASLSQALMPACGTVLQTWNGTAAYSNGPNTGTGYSCAGTGSYGYQYQCVELVMRHFTKNWGLRWYGNAKDLLNNAPSATVNVYKNGDAAHPPVPGDMLVWTSGTYGHVALITAVTSSSVEFIEQNVSGSGKASLAITNGTIAVRWGSWAAAGWAHAKANTGGGGTEPQDAGPPPVDAGTPPVDAGTPPVDAGTPPVDAGTPPVDPFTEGGGSVLGGPNSAESIPVGDIAGGCTASGLGPMFAISLLVLISASARRRALTLRR